MRINTPTPSDFTEKSVGNNTKEESSHVVFDQGNHPRKLVSVDSSSAAPQKAFAMVNQGCSTKFDRQTIHELLETDPLGYVSSTKNINFAVGRSEDRVKSANDYAKICHYLFGDSTNATHQKIYQEIIQKEALAKEIFENIKEKKKKIDAIILNDLSDNEVSRISSIKDSHEIRKEKAALKKCYREKLALSDDIFSEVEKAIKINQIISERLWSIFRNNSLSITDPEELKKKIKEGKILIVDDYFKASNNYHADTIIKKLFDNILMLINGKNARVIRKE